MGARVVWLSIALLLMTVMRTDAYWGPKARGVDWSKDPWAELKNRHLGERCIYVGNGPSLNKMDFSFMKHFDVVVGVNKIFLGFDRFNWKPNYYATTNMKVIEQSRDEIIGLDDDIVKFLRFDRWDAPEELNQQKNFVKFNSISQCGENKCKYNRGDGKYITDLTTCDKFCNNCFCDAQNYIVEGNTITYVSMQIMKHMGCKTMYLVGVDHNFAQVGEANSAQHMDGADPNHFDPRYFANMTWDLADLESSEKHYGIARTMYEANPGCGTIIDATVGGKLDVYDKINYLAMAAPKVTIIATPRPFVGEVGERQMATLHRWLALDPRPRVILLGTAPGVADAVRGLAGVEVRRSIPTLETIGVDEVTGNDASLPLLNGVLEDVADTCDVIIVSAMENIFAPDFTQILRTVWHGAGMDPTSPSPKDSKFVLMGQASFASLAQARKSTQTSKCNMKGYIHEFPDVGGPRPGPITTSPFVAVSSHVLKSLETVPQLVWSDDDLHGSAQMLGWYLSHVTHKLGGHVIDGSALVTSYLLVRDPTMRVPHVDTHPMGLAPTKHNVRVLSKHLDMEEYSRDFMDRLDSEEVREGWENVKIKEARALFSAVIPPTMLSLDALPCALEDIRHRVSPAGEHMSLRTLDEVTMHCRDGWDPHYTASVSYMAGGSSHGMALLGVAFGALMIVVLNRKQEAYSWLLWIKQRVAHFCGFELGRLRANSASSV